MRRLRLLDLGCGAGGASWGYWLSGLFRPVGVDIHAQPNYPFELRQLDVRGLYPSDVARDFDAIHASMPCQRWSRQTARNGTQANHPDLIEYVRLFMVETGLPWVMENVPEAPLLSPVLACGGAFDLVLRNDPASGNHPAMYRLKRHRHFEGGGVELLGAFAGCGCAKWAHVPVLDVTGGGDTSKPRLDGAGGRPRKGTADQCRAIMGMPWATKNELNEAIPPVYAKAAAPLLYAAARDHAVRRRHASVR